MATRRLSSAASDLYITDSMPDPSATAAGESYYYLNCQGGDDVLELSQLTARSVSLPAVPPFTHVSTSSSSCSAPQDYLTRLGSSPSHWSASKACSPVAGCLASGIVKPRGTDGGEHEPEYDNGKGVSLLKSAFTTRRNVPLTWSIGFHVVKHLKWGCTFGIMADLTAIRGSSIFQIGTEQILHNDELSQLNGLELSNCQILQGTIIREHFSQRRLTIEQDLRDMQQLHMLLKQILQNDELPKLKGLELSNCQILQGTIIREHFSQRRLTIEQDLRDMQKLRMLLKSEITQSYNRLSIVRDILSKERCYRGLRLKTCTISPFHRKSLHGVLTWMNQFHQSRADDVIGQGVKHLSMRLSQEKMTANDEKRWLSEMNKRKDQERLRPEIEEKAQEVRLREAIRNDKAMETLFMKQEETEITSDFENECFSELNGRMDEEKLSLDIEEKVHQEVLLEACSYQATHEHKNGTKMILYVDHLTGRLPVYVSIEESCLELRKLLANRLGYANFSLRFGTKLLDNDTPLKSFGISHHSVLQLSPRLLGGCEPDSTLPEFICSGISFKDRITIQNAYVEGLTSTVEDLNSAGRRLAKSIVDIFMSAHDKRKTYAGQIELSDFIVHFGRAEVKKRPKGGWNFLEWQLDCKKLAKILKQIFTSTPIYMADLVHELENVERTEMYFDWIRTYFRNHLALSPSFNRSAVVDKIMTLHNFLDENKQGVFRKKVDFVPCPIWKSANIRKAYVLSTIEIKESDYNSGFHCFRILRNFMKHGADASASDSKLDWKELEYIVAFTFGKFIPQVIKVLLSTGHDISQLLEAAVPI